MSESQDARPDGSTRALHAVAPAGVLQSAVAAAEALVAESRIAVDAEGVELVAVDPADVAVVRVALAAGAFDVYEADGRLLGADLDRFGDVLSTAGRDESVRLSFDPETRRVAVAVGELEYAMGLLDPETIREPHDPAELDVGTAAEVTLAAADLGRAVDAAAMVADHVTLACDDAGTFTAEAAGDTDDVEFAVERAALLDADPGVAESTYSLDYLANVVRPMPDDAPVTLRLGIEAPLGIDYAFADGLGSVTYALAPRRKR